MSNLITVTFLLFLTAAMHGQDQPFVVMPRIDLHGALNLCSREGVPTVDGSWEPTEGDLKGLESNLSRISKLRSMDGLRGVRIVHPSRYYRQYVAVVVGGRKMIYVNAIATEVPKDWRERLVNMCDGGTGSWGVLYDPRTHKFSELRTNGIG